MNHGHCDVQGRDPDLPGVDQAGVWTSLDLEVKDKEFLVLVGPSGCGKSTCLRMLAGLEEVNEGAIFIGDRDVTNLAPKDRDIAMVFQSYALYPHMTVRENMGFALQIAGMDKKEIAQRVDEAAKILDLEPYLERKPKAMSGGQRQRVAMGRAIVRNPQVFLMDEPLSNLDAKLRVQTRTQIAKLQRDLGVTTVYVTHDQTEAMTMGDRIVVLKDGLLMQVGTPQELYDTPNNVFVAGFIGSPAMNIIEAPLVNGNILLGGKSVPIPEPPPRPHRTRTHQRRHGHAPRGPPRHRQRHRLARRGPHRRGPRSRRLRLHRAQAPRRTRPTGRRPHRRPPDPHPRNHPQHRSHPPPRPLLRPRNRRTPRLLTQSTSHRPRSPDAAARHGHSGGA